MYVFKGGGSIFLIPSEHCFLWKSSWPIAWILKVLCNSLSSFQETIWNSFTGHSQKCLGRQQTIHLMQEKKNHSQLLIGWLWAMNYLRKCIFGSKYSQLFSPCCKHSGDQRGSLEERERALLLPSHTLVPSRLNSARPLLPLRDLRRASPSSC